VFEIAKSITKRPSKATVWKKALAEDFVGNGVQLDVWAGYAQMMFGV